MNRIGTRLDHVREGRNTAAAGPARGNPQPMRHGADAGRSLFRDIPAMTRVEHRAATGQEAPMVISPGMVARLIRRIVTGLGARPRRKR